MAPEPGIELSRSQKRELQCFLNDCTHKQEYRRALAIRMRGEGIPVADIGKQLAVSR